MNKYVKKGLSIALAAGLIATSFAGCAKINYVTNGAVEAIYKVKDGTWLQDIDETLVGAVLKLFAAVLVLVYRAQDGDHFLVGGEGDRAGHARAGALRGLDDPLRSGIDQLVIVALQPDPDLFLDCHCLFAS